MTDLNTYIGRIIDAVVNPVLGFLFVLAIAWFMWGVIQFFLYKDSTTDRDQGKQHMLWGFIGLLIMVGFYGIMQIIGGTFGVDVVRP